MNAAENPQFVEGTTTTPAQPAPAQTTLNLDPGLLDKVFERMDRVNASAFLDRPLFDLRTVSFTMDGSMCEPNVFVDTDGNYQDFQLTMRALTADEEIKVMEQVTAGGTVASVMSRAMLHALNGKVLTPRRREGLWQMLGMRGRQICFLAYRSLSNPTDIALGKYQASFTIG